MKNTVMLCLSLWLAGCVIVEDFAGAWPQAKGEPCLSKIAQSTYYQTFQREVSDTDVRELARAFTRDGEHFLLLKKNADDAGGHLYRFTIENGIFNEFRPNPAMRDMFEAEHPDAPVIIKRDTATVAALDEKTVSFLLTIAKDARYWEKKDSVLYNPLRNPACTLDDRPPLDMEEAL